MSEQPAISPSRRGRWFWATCIVILNLAAALLTMYRVRDDAHFGNAVPWQHRAAEELIGSYSALALFPLLALMVRRFPPSLRRLPRTVGVYLVAFAGYTAAHSILITLARLLFLPSSHIDPLQEIPHDLIGYTAFVAATAVWDTLERMRKRELLAEQLQRAASEAQLVALRARLHPHFLFNTLNTISSVMYEDPERADTMIAQLADMLRVLLGSPPTHQIPLSEELDLLAKYTSLLKARFGDTVHFQVDVADDVRHVLVPALLLQPLVENAVQHGRGPGIAKLTVRVRAKRNGSVLDLEVVDDGQGRAAAEAARGSGVGLGAGAERIRLMYGAQGRLDTSWGEAGRGFRVNVSIPISQEHQT